MKTETTTRTFMDTDGEFFLSSTSTSATKIGIDPGTNTGVAITIDGKLVKLATCNILEAMCLVLEQYGEKPHVYWEDARLIGWAGGGRGRLQGAGSIKRDCAIWETFFETYQIKNVAVSPKQKGAKVDAATFKRITKWGKRTNEHQRDAAMLILGR